MQYGPGEIRFARAWTRRAADHETELALALVKDLPQVQAALWQGEPSCPHPIPPVPREHDPCFDEPAAGPVYGDGEHPDLRRRERDPPAQDNTASDGTEPRGTTPRGTTPGDDDAPPPF